MRDIAVKYVAPTAPGTTSVGGPGQLQTKGVAVEQLKPYLLAALNSVPPSNPLADRATAVLQGWNGDVYTNAISSTTLHPGYVIFSAWLNGVPVNLACNNSAKIAKGILCDTFADDLPATFNVATDRASVNLLVHVLDHACHIGDPGICPNDSGVPPSRNYFNNLDPNYPNVVMSGSFDQALAALGPDPAVWSRQPRTTVPFRHALGIPGLDTGSNCLLCSPPLPPLLGSHRATYAQLIELSWPTMYSENILPLGQSGFIPYPLALDRLVHFDDQLSLYRNFKYKRMPLYRNTQLKE
jgi:Penicillin amidase